MATNGSGDWKFLLNFFLNYRKDSVRTFKEWAKMGFPQSEVENSLDPRHVGSTVTHVISVLERTRCAPMIFLGDALDEPLKAGCTRGEYIPFASRNICFTSSTLSIITLPPCHLQSPSDPSFAFLAAFTNHMLKNCTFFHIHCSKERVKQENMENCYKSCYKTGYKTSSSLLHPCPLLSCLSLSIEVPLYLHSTPLQPGWASHRRQ